MRKNRKQYILGGESPMPFHRNRNSLKEANISVQYKRNNITFNEHLYDTMWSWFQVTWKTASTNSSCNCARGGLERRFNMWRRAFFWAYFLLEMLEKMVRSPRRNERLKKAWKRKWREWGLNWNFEGSTIAKSFCVCFQASDGGRAQSCKASHRWWWIHCATSSSEREAWTEIICNSWICSSDLLPTRSIYCRDICDCIL